MERILDDAILTIRLGSGGFVMSDDLVKHVFGQLGTELVNSLDRIEVILVDHNGIERVHGIKDRTTGLNAHLRGNPSFSEAAKREAAAALELEVQIQERRRAQPEIERALGA